jgi:DNA repair protein RadA/Sms
VRNPSAIFLSGDSHGSAGSVVSVAWEGSRPLLLEIQALVADANPNYPRRLAQGIEQNRLALLVAVLQKHGGIALGGEDVFINVVGGLKFAETAADLPSILAIVSSYRDRLCRKKLMSFGEIGLAGEIRPVKFGAERIAEAAKQGFDVAIVPEMNVPKASVAGIEIIGVRKLADALAEAFG